MSALSVDGQLQSLIKSIQQPLAARIQVLESQARSYERMLCMERKRSKSLREKLKMVTSPSQRFRKIGNDIDAEQCSKIAAYTAVALVILSKHPHSRAALSSSGEGSTCGERGFVMTAGKDADVGSTAAAAVASALSQAWRCSAQKLGDDDDSSSDGSSSSILPYLPARQAFQIMVRLGGKKCVHTLSDPTVRNHVRRLTSAQVPHQEVERNGNPNPVHPASLSCTGHTKAALGASPRPSALLASSAASTSSVETQTIAAAFETAVDHGAGVTCAPQSSALSARNLQDNDASDGHDELDTVLMAHTSSHIRLRWLHDRPPNNVMIVCKPTASVMDAFASTIIKALELNMTIIVEPKMFALVLKQLWRALAGCSECAAHVDDWHDLQTLEPSVLGEVSTESAQGQGFGDRGDNAAVSSAVVKQRPGLQRHSAGARLISSKGMGGSMPVRLSALEVTHEFEEDPSAMITARGRLGAKLSATEEALDMAEALKDAFMRQMAALQGALDSLSVARPGEPRTTADLVQVERHGDTAVCLCGRLVTWQPSLGLSPSGCAECPRSIANSIDFVATLGGDGTLLWACKTMGTEPVPPIVPFAMGSLGFMTPFSSQSLPHIMEAVAAGDVRILLRHRLECSVLRHSRSSPKTGFGAASSPQGPGHESHLVLNDVSIHRGSLPYLTNLEVYCDDTFVTNVQGDGLLLATPTGSTAYSLAAGGSMVHPSCESIIFTPICPHSLSFRPLIFPDHVQLRVQVPLGVRNTELRCSFDGSHHIVLYPGDALVVHLSKYPVPTVCDVGVSTDWFRSVRDGLYWNLRGMQGGQEVEKASAA